MIITCGKCDSSFILDDSLVKPGGSKVRCSNCKNVFIAYPEKTAALKESPAESSYNFEDDPDLSKAVDAIDERDLEFTEEELGVTPGTSLDVVAPVAASFSENKDEEFPADISEKELESLFDAEETSADEPEMSVDEDDIFDSAIFEVALEEDETSAVSVDFDAEDKEVEVSAGKAADEYEDLELELDLDGDGDLDLDDEVKDDEPIGVVMTSEETDSADTVVVEDLQELGLDGDIFNIEQKVVEEDAPEETLMIEDELDFSDLERELSADFDEPAEIDELDLGLEEGEPETVLMGDDDFDFSGFELEGGELKKSDGDKASQEAEEELDFSEISKILDSAPVMEAESSDDDELDLDLDLDLFDESKADGAKKLQDIDDEEEELDFTDLEELLDELERSDRELKSGATEDLDLELDHSAAGLVETVEYEKTEAEKEDDLDFSEVEQMLSIDDDDEALAEGLDIEMELESAYEDEEKTFTRIGDEEDPDIELELDLSEEDQEEMSEVYEEDSSYDLEHDIAGAMGETGSESEDREKTGKKARVKAKPVTRRRGSFVVYLVCAVIIILLLFFLYMSKNAIGRLAGTDINLDIKPLEQLRTSISNMNIPGVSSFVASPVKDEQGKARLETSGITGKIIPGTTTGDLFVITGTVQNNYPDSRNSISLVCKLFNKSGKISQTRLFYAGNVIPEPELVNMAENMIMKRIQNRLGDNGLNAEVKPSKSIPFMVVFTRLDDTLSEFSVEAAGSMPGSAKK